MFTSSESGKCLCAVRACPRIIRQEPFPSRPIIILYSVSFFFKARRLRRFAILGGESLSFSVRNASRGKTFLQGSLLLLAYFWLLRNRMMRVV